MTLFGALLGITILLIAAGLYSQRHKHTLKFLTITDGSSLRDVSFVAYRCDTCNKVISKKIRGNFENHIEVS